MAMQRKSQDQTGQPAALDEKAMDYGKALLRNWDTTLPAVVGIIVAVARVRTSFVCRFGSGVGPVRTGRNGTAAGAQGDEGKDGAGAVAAGADGGIVAVGEQAVGDGALQQCRSGATEDEDGGPAQTATCAEETRGHRRRGKAEASMKYQFPRTGGGWNHFGFRSLK